MPLTHVCEWSEHGWKRVTAEDAAREHPGGTVSAHSGLFMCELCGQYVTFTDGEQRERYFRHSAEEMSKDCPERTFGPAYVQRHDPNEHQLPIRMVHITPEHFELEIGLLYLPAEILQKFRKERIEIVPEREPEGKRVYSMERLNEASITYLSVGSKPCAGYRLIGPAELGQYWPSYIKGVPGEGAVFEMRTGKMLTEDADVLLGRMYYLLTPHSIENIYAGVEIQELCSQAEEGAVWRIYQVLASALTEDAARFFLERHYRLTDAPMIMQPIWPVYVQTPYVIKHDEKAIVMHISGQSHVVTNVFPQTGCRKFPAVGPLRVLEIACSGRQQLISAGRSKVLQYTYFWREPLEASGELPSIQVLDGKDQPVEAGEHGQLPGGRCLSFIPPYDGTLIIKSGERIREKRKIRAGLRTEAEGIVPGTEVVILQGLDEAWHAHFYKGKATEIVGEDHILAEKLRNCSGPMLRVDHSLGAIAGELKDCSETKNWLLQAVRRGEMPREAYGYLRQVMEKKANGGTAT